MKASTVVVIVAFLTVAAVVGWRVYAMNNKTVNHFAVVADPSLSYSGGCESAVGSAERVLRGPGISPNSKLLFLALGDRSTAYEPRELAKYDVPSSRRVMEARHANESRQAILLRDLSAKCAAVRPTSISPIFLGVKEALAALHTEGCGEGSRCELRVSTDLEENVEAALKNRLNNARSNTPLPPALDNAGVDVTFCGFAATAGRIVDPTGREIRRVAGHDPAGEDRMQRVWASVFTDPERVKFEPYCPKPTNSKLYAKTGLSRTEGERP
ncbi:MAG: hypothetical protein ACHP7P_06695 [Terriglobales bacterium]